MNMAYKSDTKVCRLCRCVVESTKTAHLFSSTGVERKWAPRISLLLDVPVHRLVSPAKRGLAKSLPELEVMIEVFTLLLLKSSAWSTIRETRGDTTSFGSSSSAQLEVHHKRNGLVTKTFFQILLVGTQTRSVHRILP